MLYQDMLLIVTDNVIISPFSLSSLFFFSIEEMHSEAFPLFSFFLIKAIHYSLLTLQYSLVYTLLLWGGMAKDQHNLLAVAIFFLVPSEIQVVQELFGQSI